MKPTEVGTDIVMSVLEIKSPEYRDEITFQVYPDNQWQNPEGAPKPMLTATLYHLMK